MTTKATQIEPSGIWNIDPAHSHAEFKIRHMMISNVKGTFSGLAGTLVSKSADHTLSSVEASVEIGTINTGDAQRDTHLKSPDFFHHEEHPTMTFKSTSVDKRGEDRYSVTGNLTIHGVTHPVTFEVEGPSAPAKDPYGNIRIGLSATTKINRKDFGLTWNTALETGGVFVGEEVQIALEIQFTKS